MIDGDIQKKKIHQNTVTALDIKIMKHTVFVQWDLYSANIFMCNMCFVL